MQSLPAQQVRWASYCVCQVLSRCAPSLFLPVSQFHTHIHQQSTQVLTAFRMQPHCLFYCCPYTLSLNPHHTQQTGDGSAPTPATAGPSAAPASVQEPAAAAMVTTGGRNLPGDDMPVLTFFVCVAGGGVGWGGGWGLYLASTAMSVMCSQRLCVCSPQYTH